MADFPLPPSPTEYLSFFSYLPVELCVEIICFCPLSSVLSLASICSNFYSLISREEIQQYYLDHACLLIKLSNGTHYYERDHHMVGPYFGALLGTKTKIGFFVDGKKSGKWTSYYDSGEIMRVAVYSDGSFLSSTRWKKDGNVSLDSVSIGPFLRKSTVYEYMYGKLHVKYTLVVDAKQMTTLFSGPFSEYDNGIITKSGFYESPATPISMGTRSHRLTVGKSFSYDSNGMVSRVENRNLEGKLEGDFFFYHNGHPKVKGNISLIQDVPMVHGNVEIYGDNGDYVAIIPYVNGVKHGIANVFSGEECIFTGEYVQGKKSGLWRGSTNASQFVIGTVEVSWGNLLVVEEPDLFLIGALPTPYYVYAHFLDDHKHGTSLYYSNNHVMLRESYFYHGRPMGKWAYYDNDGLMVMTELHLDGVVVREDYQPGCNIPYTEAIYKNETLLCLRSIPTSDSSRCSLFLDNKVIN